MYPKNDLSEIQAVPVEVEDFSCGRYGRHQPPYCRDGVIIFEVGVGYRSRRHLHGQNVYLVEVNNQVPMALVEVRVYGDLWGAGLWHYLIGVDNGYPWICHVPRSVETISEAVDYLKPAEVKRAEARGLMVQRQGIGFLSPS